MKVYVSDTLDTVESSGIVYSLLDDPNFSQETQEEKKVVQKREVRKQKRPLIHENGKSTKKFLQ